MAKGKVFFSIPGAARQLDISESRTRQLYQANLLQSDASLDGKRPLFSNDAIARHREKRSQAQLRG